MTTFSRAALAFGVSGLMTIAGTAGVAHADSGTATSGWNVVSTGTLPDGLLDAVAASDARHAWAVGTRRFPSQADGDGVVQAWNGRTWRTVAGTPAVAEYTAVSARNAADVWAVGRTAESDPVAAHYDGRRWSRSSVRGLPAGQGLDGVAIAGGRTWVIADTDVFVRTKAGWSGTRLADPAHDGHLQAVRARGPKDVWVVGIDHLEGEKGRPFPNRPARSLVWHWNGRSWRALPPVGVAGTLRDVVARSATDVWAVGDWYGSAQSVAVHWNGRTWTTKAPSDGRQAYAAVADPAGGVWAAQSPYAVPDSLTLSRYANGTWTAVHPAAPAGSADMALHGLARVPGTRTLWAVGGSHAGGGGGEVILRRTS